MIEITIDNTESSTYIIERVHKNIVYILEVAIINNKLIYRTHFLSHLFNKDLEIRLLTEPNEIDRIIKYMIDVQLSEDSIDICDGLITDKLTNAPVEIKLIETSIPQFDGEEVFQIIFSDEQFRLPSEEGCDPRYLEQVI